MSGARPRPRPTDGPARRLARRRRRAVVRTARRGAAALALALVGFGTLLWIRTWWLTSQAPSWWHAATPPISARATERAELLERGVSSALYRLPEQDGPWTVEVHAEDVSAWLAQRLPRWLDNRGLQWPRAVSFPRVWFAHGMVMAGVTITPAPGAAPRVVAVTFTPAMSDRAELSAQAVEVQIGRLAIPASRALARLGPWLPEGLPADQTVQWVAQVVEGKRPMVSRLHVRLDDGRLVRLTGFELIDGAIRLTCVSEPAPPPTSAALSVP